MGLKSKDIAFLESGIDAIIKKFTSEAGGRNLNSANVRRKVARKKAEGSMDSSTKITSKNLDLGIPKNSGDIVFSNDIGVATGLAWTEFGGEILNIEVSKMKSKGGLVLILTGKLGM